MQSSEIDVLNNKQNKLGNVKYVYDDMIGCLNIGKGRTNQEDAILLMENNEFKDFKLIALADGMGGLENGEIASNAILRCVLEWFETLKSYYYYYPRLVYEDFMSSLSYFDKCVREKSGKGGTTLSIAIATNNDTICFNVGDSRIYTFSNHLTQISTDQSIAWRLYEKRKIKFKEDIIFSKEKNLITSSFGNPKYRFSPICKIIPNRKYKYLILMSDGITDIITDDEIEDIIYEYGYKGFVENAIQAAMGKTKVQDYLDKNEYYERVTGNDNLSAIILRKGKTK